MDKGVQRLLADGAGGDQMLPKSAAMSGLQREGIVRLLYGDELCPDQKMAELYSKCDGDLQ